MDTKDFSVFHSLFSDVYAKAFGEPITKLPYAKAQMLSWLIEKATGEILSYKSLKRYADAALKGSAAGINPTVSTLTILVKFLNAGEPPVSGRHVLRMGDSAAWFRYRSKMLAPAAAI